MAPDWMRRLWGRGDPPTDPAHDLGAWLAERAPRAALVVREQRADDGTRDYVIAGQAPTDPGSGLWRAGGPTVGHDTLAEALREAGQLAERAGLDGVTVEAPGMGWQRERIAGAVQLEHAAAAVEAWERSMAAPPGPEERAQLAGAFPEWGYVTGSREAEALGVIAEGERQGRTLEEIAARIAERAAGPGQLHRLQGTAADPVAVADGATIEAERDVHAEHAAMIEDARALAQAREEDAFAAELAAVVTDEAEIEREPDDDRDPTVRLADVRAALDRASYGGPAASGKTSHREAELEESAPIAARAYVGTRTEAQGAVIAVEQDGERRPLRHIVHHSPTGLEWGYGGSGPSDAACSILADATGERPDLREYQAFTHEVVAKLPREGFRLEAEQVADWHADYAVREAERQADRDLARGGWER